MRCLHEAGTGRTQSPGPVHDPVHRPADHCGAVMPVFVAANSNFDPLLIEAPNQNTAEDWINKNVKSFVCITIGPASGELIKRAMKFGEPIIKVAEQPNGRN